MSFETNQLPNRNYKDTLFVHLFGKCIFAKEYFLELYNALHDTNLKIGEVEITPCMLENTVYRGGLYNDVSMLIDDKIVVLIEQQTNLCMEAQ